MSSPDQTPQGIPYAIGQVVLDVLRSDPALTGLVVSENPSTPADIADGPRILIFKDLGDAPVEERGGSQKRSYSFQAGSMARTPTARYDAHGDYRAMKRAVRRELSRFQAANVWIQSVLREGAVAFTLDEDGVDGALVLGTFSIDYRDSNDG